MVKDDDIPSVNTLDGYVVAVLLIILVILLIKIIT